MKTPCKSSWSLFYAAVMKSQFQLKAIKGRETTE